MLAGWYYDRRSKDAGGERVQKCGNRGDEGVRGDLKEHVTAGRICDQLSGDGMMWIVTVRSMTSNMWTSILTCFR